MANPLARTTSWKGSLPFLLLALLAVTVVGLDQLSKSWVVASLPEGHWWSPLPGELGDLFRITHTTNSGAAFGILPNQGNLFILIAVAVVIAIVVYYRQLPAGDWLIRISLGLQLGGAIGNLLDRLRLGYVIDFIDISFWPIFNLADASITIGILLIVYRLWRIEHMERGKASSERSRVDGEAQS